LRNGAYADPKLNKIRAEANIGERLPTTNPDADRDRWIRIDTNGCGRSKTKSMIKIKMPAAKFFAASWCLWGIGCDHRLIRRSIAERSAALAEYEHESERQPACEGIDEFIHKLYDDVQVELYCDGRVSLSAS
jgi:hypothetical protein